MAYAPQMQVTHRHDSEIAVFLAKQVCHGWGAQRLMVQRPDVRWHGGHLRAVARVCGLVRRVPARRQLARQLARSALAGGALIDRLGPTRLPFAPTCALVTALDKTAALAGHLSYDESGHEPLVSEVLGRPFARN